MTRGRVDGIDMDSLKAALRKLRQLEHEIARVEDQPALRSNLQHTRSKLGIFLDEAFPRGVWRRAWEEIAREDEEDA